MPAVALTSVTQAIHHVVNFRRSPYGPSTIRPLSRCSLLDGFVHPVGGADISSAEELIATS